MDGSTTLTIRLGKDVKKKLGKLADDTDRSKSFLAARAIADYVEREREIVADIKRRLAEVRSGKARLIPHDEAMTRVRATIDRIARSKR